MNKLDITKTVVNTMIDVGVGIIVGGIAVAFTPAKTKALGKLCVCLAGAALTGMVAAKAEQHTNKIIDEIAAAVKYGKDLANNQSY